MNSQLRQFLPLGLALISLIVHFTSCEKKDPVNEHEPSDSFSVGPEGGTFTLESGIEVFIPPSALNTTVDLTIQTLDYTSYAAMQDHPVDEGYWLFGLEGTPDGTTFQVPIEVTVPDVELPPGTVAILKEVAPGVHPLPEATLEYNRKEKLLLIRFNHFSAKSAEAMDAYAAEQCAQEPCKCEGDFFVEQQDGDNVCDNGTCQVVESIVSVLYPACSPDPEISVFREVTDGCTATLSLSSADSSVAIGTTTQLTAMVELGCVPIHNQSVDFVSDGLGSIQPTFVPTDEKGHSRTKFTAGNEAGVSTVTANATISYYRTQVEANGRKFNGDLVTIPATTTHSIEIIDTVETWQGTFRAVFNDCDPMVCLSNYHIEAEFQVTLTPAGWETGHTIEPGFLDLTQYGQFIPVVEGYIFQNIYQNNGSTHEYHLLLDKSDRVAEVFIYTDIDFNENLYSFDLYFGGTEPDYKVGNWIGSILSKDGKGAPFRVSLKNSTDTISGSCYIDSEILGTYTLTMNRLDP